MIEPYGRKDMSETRLTDFSLEVFRFTKMFGTASDEKTV